MVGIRVGTQKRERKYRTAFWQICCGNHINFFVLYFLCPFISYDKNRFDKTSICVSKLYLKFLTKPIDNYLFPGYGHKTNKASKRTTERGTCYLSLIQNTNLNLAGQKIWKFIWVYKLLIYGMFIKSKRVYLVYSTMIFEPIIVKHLSEWSSRYIYKNDMKKSLDFSKYGSEWWFKALQVTNKAWAWPMTLTYWTPHNPGKQRMFYWNEYLGYLKTKTTYCHRAFAICLIYMGVAIYVKPHQFRLIHSIKLSDYEWVTNIQTHFKKQIFQQIDNIDRNRR